MTRPRVPDDKRIRIAQACGFCKTRKQKCDGQRPCSLCIRKKNADNCSYDGVNRFRAAAGPSAKRRLDDPTAAVTPPALPQPPSPVKTDSPSGSSMDASTPFSVAAMTSYTPVGGTGSASGLSPEANFPPPPIVEAAAASASPHGNMRSADPAPGAGSWSEAPPEGPSSWMDVRIPAHLYATERMLGLSLPEGDTVNLLGCSSHLAYLDALRNVLEVTFMANPLLRPLDLRFRLMELRPSLAQPDVTLPVDLPGERETYVLVEEYLIHTYGLLQVYDEEETMDLTVRSIIAEGNRDTRGRVLLYLTLALGRVLAGPEAEPIIRDIDAEAYFQSANAMVSEWSKDLWTVRALLLKCFYTLSVVRRNEGYEYIGRAGWLAQLLGMHREEHLLMRYDDMMKNGRPWSFNPSTGRLRRNVWRSLLVLDRFVAAQLGRPPVVSDGTAFPGPPEDTEGDQTSLPPVVRGVGLLSMILTKIYARPETSAAIAAEISQHIPGWPSVSAIIANNDALGMPPPTTPAEHRRLAMHLLLGKLLKFHCLNLLGRPFVLFDAHYKGPHETHPLAGGGEVFPRNAIEASYMVVSAVSDARRAGFLPRRNPFVVNSVFSSALVVISQEISSEAWKSCHDPILRGDQHIAAIHSALEFFVYASDVDAQAKHLLGLLRYLCSKCKNPLLSEMAAASAESSHTHTGFSTPQSASSMVSGQQDQLPHRQHHHPQLDQVPPPEQPPLFPQPPPPLFAVPSISDG
ncbi:hypothetical protein MAPG_06859 [Magnaporthiopsis poae ATCC 64411]|uniref:Zn(2)-C6 fungal-type domain-containing protein n=1 Tax=Magnaporthiopsis poae (strain ATCC 64411 / 73-15) TaxID=644358 RepID=A0A0C4E366_MAGP6|nr:hypothetical protein MAPG_06859 [Magnaporthiopsis poae ATCC 64411]